MAVNVTAEALDHARTFHRQLCELVDGLDVPANLRMRLSGGCCWIAFDLHAAIITCIERELVASAFVLSRPIWEALIRGLWLVECADDAALLRFQDDKSIPKPWTMIQDLEQTEGFDIGILSKVHANNKSRLDSMTHIGGPLAIRCNTSEHIASNFEPEEIVECLNHANSVAGLAALCLSRLADDGALALRLLELAKS